MSRSVTRWGLGRDARRWTLDGRLSCQRRSTLVAESASCWIHTATCGARTFQLGATGITELCPCRILMLTAGAEHHAPPYWRLLRLAYPWASSSLTMRKPSGCGAATVTFHSFLSPVFLSPATVP